MNIKEIANLANVSTATVSLVMNNKAGISDQTREKILKIANENGYRPYSRRPSSRLSGNIRFIKYIDTGIIVNKNKEYISEIIDSIESVSRDNGFNLLLTAFFDKNSFDEILNILKQNPPDGIFILGTEFCGLISEKLLQIDLPMVVIDNNVPSFDMNCVQPNNKEIVQSAIKYLHHRGYKTIGYLRSNVQINCFKERNEGFREGLTLCDLPYFPGYEFRVTPTINSSYKELLSIFNSTPLLPGVFFCDNDAIAIGALKALQKLNYKVPKDISIMGFGDIPSAAIIEPSLTTMKVDRIGLAKFAVQLLLNNIHDKNCATAKIQMSGSVVVRNSTK